MRVTIWGCRGSVPTPGPDTVTYGGNTSCVEVLLDDSTVLVLRGWIYPTDASINIALSQQTAVTPMMPSLEVRDARGRWTTLAIVMISDIVDGVVDLLPRRDFPFRRLET